jgi:2-polyprenyl-3-methyl-5-hydroxy-6-metoxy-1,4-benzoquinol methylase
VLAIDQITENLELDQDGIWHARHKSEAVAYPEAGNEGCQMIEDGSFWFQHRNAAIVNALKLFPPPGQIFDVGGGNGYVALGIQQAGFQVGLVEPGPNGARNAVKRGVQSVICATLQEANFRSGSIPAIGIFDVLEHIEDELGFLRTIHSLLQEQGRIYISVPAYQFLWSEEDAFTKHYRRYTLSSLSRILDQTGFRCDYRSYIFSFLPVPIFLTRTLPGILKIKRAGKLSRYQNEHQPKSSITSGLLAFLLKQELKVLRSGVRIPFGGSCLVVARRSDD